MKDIYNHSKFLFLEKRLQRQVEQGKNAIPFAFVPDGLEAYCKVFYTIYKDVDLDQETRDWAKYPRNTLAYEALTKRNLCPKPNFNARRVRWNEIAKEQHIEFKQDFNLSYFPTWSVKYVYDEMSLIDCETANHLVDILVRAGSTPDYYFGYWRVPQNMKDNNYRKLYEANLVQDGILTNTEIVLGGSSAFWWAVDETWFMGRVEETDWYFSFIGASRKIVSMLLFDNDLESIEVKVE
jgi:hypothetical protein